MAPSAVRGGSARCAAAGDRTCLAPHRLPDGDPEVYLSGFQGLMLTLPVVPRSMRSPKPIGITCTGRAPVGLTASFQPTAGGMSVRSTVLCQVIRKTALCSGATVKVVAG